MAGRDEDWHFRVYVDSIVTTSLSDDAFRGSFHDGTLRLGYPWLPEKGFDHYDHEGRFSAFFDELDRRHGVYDGTTSLEIDTDSHYNPPKCLLRFVKLENLHVKGTRWFHLTCENIPSTVVRLDLANQANLNYGFAEGMDRLANLEELSVNVAFLFDLLEEYDDRGEEKWSIVGPESKNIRGQETAETLFSPAIPVLPNLKRVMVTDYDDTAFTYDPFNSDSCEKVLEHPLFANLRGATVTLDDSVRFKIRVELPVPSVAQSLAEINELILRRLEASTEGFSGLRSDLQVMGVVLKEGLSKLSASMSSATEAMEGLSTAVGGLGGAVDELCNGMDRLGGGVDKLGGAVDGLGGAVDELCTAVDKSAL
jgi:hypothetical protein